MEKKDELFIKFSKMPNVNKSWGLFFAMGILLIILGVLAIGYAKWATEFTVIFLGVLLTVGGVLQIASGFYAKKWTGFSFSFLLGIFYIVAGLVCTFKPMDSALTIGILIAVLLLVGGLFRMISALRFRFDKWGWMVVNGLISILLGLLILAEWPESAIWVIGLFVGIDLLIMGMYWVKLSWAARQLK
jgi:uncharacterized membrane protein HdeD (DUF308 family)